jgi:hypothetical protein
VHRFFALQLRDLEATDMTDMAGLLEDGSEIAGVCMLM